MYILKHGVVYDGDLSYSVPDSWYHQQAGANTRCTQLPTYLRVSLPYVWITSQRSLKEIVGSRLAGPGQAELLRCFSWLRLAGSRVR